MMSGRVRPRPGRRSLVLVACLLLAGIGLTALGSWQLARREWKHALIARVTERLHAPALDLAALSWTADTDWRAQEYRTVRLTGRALPSAAVFVVAATGLGSGYWLMMPVQLGPARVVMVNLGFVEMDAAHPLGAPGRPVLALADGDALALEGLLRLSEPGGTRLRSNDAARERWYSRDLAVMAAARDLPLAPFFVDAAARPAVAVRPATGQGGTTLVPVGGLTTVTFPDNHLVYALTWYALALGAGAGALLVLREDRRLRAGGPEAADGSGDGQRGEQDDAGRGGNRPGA